MHLFEYWSLYIRAVEILSLAYTEAYKQDKTTILSYKCLMSLLDTIRECGLVSPELQKTVTARQRFDGNPEVINEAASLALDFAHATYATLRSTVKAKGKALSSEDTKLFKAIDRSFHYKSPRRKTTSPTKN